MFDDMSPDAALLLNILVVVLNVVLFHIFSASIWNYWPLLLGLLCACVLYWYIAQRLAQCVARHVSGVLWSGARVTYDVAYLSPSEGGSLIIRGLSVLSPPPFLSKHMFRCDRVCASVDWLHWLLSRGDVRIDAFEADGSVLTFELEKGRLPNIRKALRCLGVFEVSERRTDGSALVRRGIVRGVVVRWPSFLLNVTERLVLTDSVEVVAGDSRGTSGVAGLVSAQHMCRTLASRVLMHCVKLILDGNVLFFRNIDKASTDAALRTLLSLSERSVKLMERKTSGRRRRASAAKASSSATSSTKRARETSHSLLSSLRRRQRESEATMRGSDDAHGGDEDEEMLSAPHIGIVQRHSAEQEGELVQRARALVLESHRGFRSSGAITDTGNGGGGAANANSLSSDRDYASTPVYSLEIDSDSSSSLTSRRPNTFARIRHRLTRSKKLSDSDAERSAPVDFHAYRSHAPPLTQSLDEAALRYTTANHGVANVPTSASTLSHSSKTRHYHQHQHHQHAKLPRSDSSKRRKNKTKR